MPGRSVFDTLRDITSNLTKLHQDNLVSVYTKKQVDGQDTFFGEIPLILILKKSSIESLFLHTQIQAIQKYPIKFTIFTQDEISRSGDVFPIEFLDIKRDRLLLAGEDFFSTIEIHLHFLRHECEFYLRSHLLKLREGFSKNPKSASDLIRFSFPSFLALFPHLLKLNSIAFSDTDATSLIQEIQTRFSCEIPIFLKINETLKQDPKLKKGDVFFKDYLEAIKALILAVDTVQTHA